MAADKGTEGGGKGGRLKLFLIALGLIVVAGGGAAGYWFFAMKPQPKASAAAAEAHPKEAEAGAALKFEPFVVNLADEGGSRYLRVGLSLVVNGDEEAVKELEHTKVKLLRVRSAVLELLAQQTAEQVVTSQGKQGLKTSIEKSANDVLAPMEVTDVLFTEFVVQF
jgi:flagellar FliL protein